MKLLNKKRKFFKLLKGQKNRSLVWILCIGMVLRIGYVM